jgi:alkanesulfonate monooxygenase SsuD/methylene tetrahydromethanopterin reductase-like flavin-dependent oxidoreductase (luciferase family)
VARSRVHGRAILGLGRGLGHVEFDAFRLNMAESRQRFVEHAEATVAALETGYMEYEGALFSQPPAAIRPFPAFSFRGRVYASAVSPESIEIMARMSAGILIIAQKPWATTLNELAMDRSMYRETNDAEPPKPLLVSHVAVNESEGQAHQMYEQHILRYSRSAVGHDEFDNVRLADIPGYEYYGAPAANIEKYGLEKFCAFLANLQVWAHTRPGVGAPHPTPGHGQSRRRHRRAVPRGDALHRSRGQPAPVC